MKKLKLTRKEKLLWVKALGWEISGLLLFYSFFKFLTITAVQASVAWFIVRMMMYYYYDKFWRKLDL